MTARAPKRVMHVDSTVLCLCWVLGTHLKGVGLNVERGSGVQQVHTTSFQIPLIAPVVGYGLSLVSNRMYFRTFPNGAMHCSSFWSNNTSHHCQPLELHMPPPHTLQHAAPGHVLCR